jgi:hypothetical protein
VLERNFLVEVILATPDAAPLVFRKGLLLEEEYRFDIKRIIYINKKNLAHPENFEKRDY